MCSVSGCFEGRVALITGASRGIGRGIALLLAAEGSDVVVNYHTHRHEAEEVARAVAACGQRALVVRADVASRDAVEGMFEAALADFGRLDVVAANAVAFLASDQAEYVTGATLRVDGGFTLGLRLPEG